MLGRCCSPQGTSRDSFYKLKEKDTKRKEIKIIRTIIKLYIYCTSSSTCTCTYTVNLPQELKTIPDHPFVKNTFHLIILLHSYDLFLIDTCLKGTCVYFASPSLPPFFLFLPFPFSLPPLSITHTHFSLYLHIYLPLPLPPPPPPLSPPLSLCPLYFFFLSLPSLLFFVFLSLPNSPPLPFLLPYPPSYFLAHLLASLLYFLCLSIILLSHSLSRWGSQIR